VTRVLLVAHGLPPDEYTGTPLTTYGYARGLAARGHDVTVLHATPTGGSWLATPERRVDESFARVAVPRVVDGMRPDLEWSITAASRAPRAWSRASQARLLRALEPDVVHIVNNVHLPLELPEVAASLGIPVVRSVTGGEDLCGLVIPLSPADPGPGPCAPPLSAEVCSRCLRHALDVIGPIDVELPAERLSVLMAQKRRRAAHQFHDAFASVVFPSHRFRRYFEATLPLDPARTRVVPMGLELDVWGGDAIARERPPRPARAGDGPVVFAVAATLDPAKGIPAIVDAFSSAALASRDDWRLRFHGEGDRELLAPLADDARVEVLGAYAADDLPNLLAAADLGISATRFETFHRVTHEYLLAGLPVIGTPVGSIPEVVRDGVNGRLLAGSDAGELARAVLELLDDRSLLARLTEGARTTPVRSVADELDDLLEEYDRVAATLPAP
jgi:glycosyltransferase involved in cell wall biosynthesis